MPEVKYTSTRFHGTREHHRDSLSSCLLSPRLGDSTHERGLPGFLLGGPCPLCCVPPAMPSADRGVIGGPGRRRPQEGHPTPACNQGQRGGETEKKHIQGLHTIDLLQALRFCCTWALLRPHVSLGVIKPLMWELHDACVRPCALIPGAATLPLRPAVILFSLPCGLGSSGQAAGQSCQLSVPCGRL
jgi:hypothetical protein